MGSALTVLYGIVKRFFRTVQENTKTDVYKESKQQIMLNSLSIFLREKNVPHSYQKVRFVTWQIIMHANTPLTSFNELMYANLHDLLFRFFFMIWFVIWLFMDTEIKWTISFISFSFLLEVISGEI